MWIQQMDEAISQAMLLWHGSDFINQVLKFFTYLGEGGIFWIVFAVAALAFCIIKNKKVPMVLVCLIVVGALGWLTNDYIIKPLVARVRPYQNTEVFGDAFAVFMDAIAYKHPSGYSFPSGHSYTAFYAALAATLYYKKSAYVLYPIAVLIAFSRVFLGAHYFTDVFVGLVWSSVLAVVGYWLGNKIYALPKVNGNKYISR